MVFITTHTNFDLSPTRIAWGYLYPKEPNKAYISDGAWKVPSSEIGLRRKILFELMMLIR